MSDWNYVPSYGTELAPELYVDAQGYGDGYERTAPSGIHPKREVWNLRYDNITAADADAMEAYLDSKIGQSFTWTPPGRSEKRYQQKSALSRVYIGGVVVGCTVTFKEYFGP